MPALERWPERSERPTQPTPSQGAGLARARPLMLARDMATRERSERETEATPSWVAGLARARPPCWPETRPHASAASGKPSRRRAGWPGSLALALHAGPRHGHTRAQRAANRADAELGGRARSRSPSHAGPRDMATRERSERQTEPTPSWVAGLARARPPCWPESWPHASTASGKPRRRRAGWPGSLTLALSCRP
jgi:hypothetical protein